jgi:siroheme decarboxylase
MIHGRERGAVLAQLGELRSRLDIAQVPHEVLFSRRCFTQRGARYG